MWIVRESNRSMCRMLARARATTDEPAVRYERHDLDLLELPADKVDIINGNREQFLKAIK